MAYEEILGAFFGGALFTFLLASLAFLAVLAAAIYVYYAMAWMTIGNKLKYKYPWLAWIPFANISMILQMGSFSWAWVFLLFIPVLGWIALAVLCLIASWRIFELRKYPGWLCLLVLIPQAGVLINAIVIGFVAWKDNEKAAAKQPKK
jgi:hypothetical protein